MIRTRNAEIRFNHESINELEANAETYSEIVLPKFW